MEVVGRKGSAVLLQHMGRRLDWTVQWMHSALPRQPVALERLQVAQAVTTLLQIVRPPRERNEMVEGQVVRGYGSPQYWHVNGRPERR